MSNTYTDKLIKRMPAPGDYDWDDEWHDNEKIDDFVAGAVLAGNNVLTGGVVSDGGGLNADYAAISAQIAGLVVEAVAGSVVLAASDLNYIYMDDTGTVTAAVGPPSGDYVPLALVDTDLTDVLRIGDVRPMSDKVVPPSGVEITGGIAGLVLSNNVTDTEHDIDVSPGLCKDSTGMVSILLSAAITKQIDAAWAAGSAAGGLLNGSVAANILYHVYLLRKDADGTVDVGFLADGDDIGTYLPTGYSSYRWIGYVLTEASANIRNFTMHNTTFVFKNAWEIISNLNVAVLTAQDLSAVLPSGRTLRVEIGVGGTPTMDPNYVLAGPNSNEAEVCLTADMSSTWNSVLIPLYKNGWVYVSAETIFLSTILSTDIWLKSVEFIR